MIHFISKRLKHSLILLFMASLVCFTLVVSAPGNVAVLIAELRGAVATPGYVEKVAEEIGLHKPLLVRYVDWLGDAVRGNFGMLQFAPQDFVNIPRFGMIQYHPSLLPNYRGPSSINWPIIKGDAKTGLTIFRPNDGLDEGPVILQKTVAIGPDDTLGSLYFNQLFPLGVEAMLEAADLVVAGRHQEVVQDENHASYEGWCRDKEARINWHGHLDHTYNLIRGCDPSPGAWTMIGDTKLRIYETRKHPVRRFGDVGGKPGEIAAIGEKGVEIIVQGGRLELLKVRPEGGAKMSAAEFFRSTGLSEGDAIEDLKVFSEAA